MLESEGRKSFVLFTETTGESIHTNTRTVIPLSELHPPFPSVPPPTIHYISPGRSVSWHEVDVG